MKDEGFDPANFPMPAASMQAFIKQYVPEDDDSGAIASFEVVREFKPAKSAAATEAAQKIDQMAPMVEIWEDVIYVRINIRGNDKIEVHQPASDIHKRRFPFAWQEFQRGEQGALRGTHLSKIGGMEANIIRAFNAKNVFTVEDLAQVSDNNLQNLGSGAREMRSKAVDFVRTKDALRNVDEERNELRATVEKQAQDMAKLMALVEKQNEELSKLQAKKSKEI